MRALRSCGQPGLHAALTHSVMPLLAADRGGGDSRAVQTFDRGEYACANNGQEDYSVITRPFFLQLLQV